MAEFFAVRAQILRAFVFPVVSTARGTHAFAFSMVSFARIAISALARDVPRGTSGFRSESARSGRVGYVTRPTRKFEANGHESHKAASAASEESESTGLYLAALE